MTNEPAEFADRKALTEWARSSSFGGARIDELAAASQSLVVVFRRHTSGVPTSEVFVFAERDGKWHRLLWAATGRWEATATVEGDHLTVWGCKGEVWACQEAGQRTEWLRLNVPEAVRRLHVRPARKP